MNYIYFTMNNLSIQKKNSFVDSLFFDDFQYDYHRGAGCYSYQYEDDSGRVLVTFYYFFSSKLFILLLQ